MLLLHFPPASDLDRLASVNESGSLVHHAFSGPNKSGFALRDLANVINLVCCNASIADTIPIGCVTFLTVYNVAAFADQHGRF